MNFDYELFKAINGLAGHWHFLDITMFAIAKWGILLYGAVLVILWYKKVSPEDMVANRKLVFKAFLSAGIALAINQIIGLAYFRQRPFAFHKVTLLLDRSPDASFPSDHATGGSSIAASILGGDNFWGAVLAGFTLVMVFARIYCGTHYPFDVLGGMATGLFGNYVANKIWPYLNGIADKILDLWDTVFARFN